MTLPTNTNPRLTDIIGDAAYDRLGNSGVDSLRDLMDKFYQFLGFPIEVTPTSPISTSLNYSAGIYTLPDGQRMMSLNGSIASDLTAGLISFASGTISSGTNNSFSLPTMAAGQYIKALVEYNVNTNAVNIRFGTPSVSLSTASIPRGSYGFRSVYLIELFSPLGGVGSWSLISKSNIVRITGSREAEEYGSSGIVSDGDTYSVAITKLDTALYDVLTNHAEEDLFVVDSPTGQMDFSSTTLEWSIDNSIPDISVFRNGIKQVQDYAGASGYDFQKTSINSIRFAYVVAENERVLIRDERTGGTGGGGGGGTDLTVKDEGTILSSTVTELNFTGTGVTASLVAPGRVQISIPGAGGGYTSLQKLVKNGSGSIIPIGKVLAWKDDGTVTLADANISTLSDFAGITASPIAVDDFGYAIKSGNIPNCLATLGASPGQLVYLGETPGELTLIAPTGLTDTIFKIGRAEPPDGVAQANAVDLYLEPEIIAEP